MIYQIYIYKIYKRYMNNIGLEMVEISDGSINMDHHEKCKIIADFSKDFRVISEVGSKDPTIQISSKDWLKWMQNELSAGSWKVIAEAREGGNVGIFGPQEWFHWIRNQFL